MEKIDGVQDIETDVDNRLASFRVPEDNTEYLDQIKEFAETNTHLEGYEVEQPDEG